MGAFAPTVSGALQGLDGLIQAVPAVQAAQNIAGLANTIRDRDDDDLKRQQNQALDELRAKQKLQEQQLAANVAAEREKIAVQAANEEQNRRSALRRAVARQRASFGASGIGNASGGSSQAVLLGLFEESEADKTARTRLDNLRNAALDQELSQNRSLNVLQRTQLQERQRLQRELSRTGFGQNLF